MLLILLDVPYNLKYKNRLDENLLLFISLKKIFRLLTYSIKE